jgi:carbon-monoxide dehydrogenase large subunit
MGMEGIGARVARKEDKRFITGKGRYTDDMVVPGMKHAHFIRSPHAHAKIKSIDTSPLKRCRALSAFSTARNWPRTRSETSSAAG